MNSIKLYILTLISIFILKNTCAQNWQWAKSAGSTSIDHLQDICTDNNGNIYTIGQFGFITPTASYMIFDTDTVWNNGVNQIFVAKYSSNGNIVWAKGIGGYNGSSGMICSNCEYGNRVFFDSLSNSLYITGIISGVVSFGNTSLAASNDLFLTKLDLNGNFLWANLIVSNQFVSNSAITTDLTGSVYISGYCADSIAFDLTKIKAGGFLAKYTSNGILSWAKQKFTDSGALDIKVLDNEIFILGAITNDTAKIDTFSYVSNLNSNMFFARFDSNCVIKLLKYPSSNGLVSASNMDIDKYGNFYIIGGFQSDINFNGTILTNSNIDMFLFKCDRNGNLLWAKQAYSNNTVSGVHVVSATNSTIYIQGTITGGATFGQYSINSNLNNSTYFTAIDTSGIFLAVDQLTGNSQTQIASDNSGSFIIGGIFTTNATNPSLTIGNTSLTSIYASDIFIAKHDAITGIPDPRRSTNKQLFIHANPNEGKCNITVPDEFAHEKNLVLSIYNSSGKLIQQKKLEMSEGKIKLSLEAEAKGLYNAVLSNGTKSYSGKIVFE